MLKLRLIAERMTAVDETLERPLISVLARMERRGIWIYRQVLSRLSGDFAQTAARGKNLEIQESPASLRRRQPQQLGDIIFGKMVLPGGSKTKTGAWSTSAQVLDELAEQGHEFPEEDSGMAAGVLKTRNRPIPETRCRPMCIRSRFVSTPPMHWRRPPPGGCHI